MSVNYTVAGSGSPVLLIHGLFGSLENLGVIARQLKQKHQVISIDLPDHGQSAHSDNFDLSGYADAIRTVMKQLGIAKAILLGHSLGGKVAMQLALETPEQVEKLIVADIAPVAYPARHQNVFAALHSFSPSEINSRGEADNHMAKHLTEPGIRQFLLKSLHKGETGFRWRFNLPVLHRDYEVLSQGLEIDASFHGPTLFIKGGNSDYITAEHQEDIMRLFPKATAKVIAGTGHWLHAEKPFVFAGIAQRFIDEDHD